MKEKDRRKHRKKKVRMGNRQREEANDAALCRCFRHFKCFIKTSVLDGYFISSALVCQQKSNMRLPNINFANSRTLQ